MDHERYQDRHIQVKEGELARVVAELVDETAGQVTTEDSTEVAFGHLENN
jgi:hypothetical protein